MALDQWEISPRLHGGDRSCRNHMALVMSEGRYKLHQPRARGAPRLAVTTDAGVAL